MSPNKKVTLEAAKTEASQSCEYKKTESNNARKQQKEEKDFDQNESYEINECSLS